MRRAIVAWPLVMAVCVAGPGAAQDTPFDTLLEEARLGEAGDCRVMAVAYWISQRQPQVVDAFASIAEVMESVAPAQDYAALGCEEAYLWALTSCAPPVMSVADHIISPGLPDESEADAANRVRGCLAQLDAERIKPR